MEGAEFGRFMSRTRYFSTLYDAERVVITGATGWMGRELISRLNTFRPDLAILPIAGRPRKFSIGDRLVEAATWDHDVISRWNPTVAVHLAFLTRELEAALGADDYLKQNEDLSERAALFYGIPSIRAIVVASSGAAIAQRDTPYGRLKFDDEKRFTLLGQRWGIPTLIARIWSVSGAHCPKPGLFALYDLIDQTRHSPVVRIRAAHEVRRRYVDAGEYLEVCLGAAGVGHSGVIDSGGPEVEIGELADLVQDVLGIPRPIERPPRVNPPDVYLSNSSDAERWAEDLGIGLSDLAVQIQQSSKAVAD